MPLSFQCLFQLPIAVSAELLHGWITVVDVVRMDSAFCSKECRYLWLSIIGSNGLKVSVTSWLDMETSKELFAWCISRRVRGIRELNFTGNPRCFAGTTLQFMQMVGPNLQEFGYCLQDSPPALLLLVSQNCPNITTTNIQGCKDNSYILTLYLAGISSKLRVLTLLNCELRTSVEFDGITFPKLQTLRASEMASDAVAAIVSVSPALTALHIFSVNNADSILTAATTACVPLRLLGMDNCDCSSYALTAVFSALTTITGICVSRLWQASFTDDCMTALLTHCKDLEGISMINCPGVTDAGVDVIAEHCAGLKHLEIDPNGGVSPGRIMLVLSKCKQLVDFAVDGTDSQGDIVYSSAELAGMILAACPSLRTLDFSRVRVDSTILRILALRCDELQELRFHNLHEDSDISYLPTVVSMAAKLKLVDLGKNNIAACEVMAEQLRNAHPGLRIWTRSTFVKYWGSFWESIYPEA